MFVRLKGCVRCAGDLVLDAGEWKCWQCGHYYYGWRGASYPEPLPGHGTRSQPQKGGGPEPPLHTAGLGARRGATGARKRSEYGPRASRNINSVVRAKKTSDDRWWARNRQIIQYLDQNLSIREIARLMGLGERQVRSVRERLADLRAAAEEAKSGQ